MYARQRYKMCYTRIAFAAGLRPQAHRAPSHVMKAGFVFLALAASAVGQKVTIASPAANTEVKAGGNLLVEIDRPDTQTPSTDVAIMIGLQPCGAAGDCDAVAANYARVLFHGPYTPKPVEGHADISHNYTVKIPRNTAAGRALLQVAHFFYMGAGNQPQMETLNTVIQITA
ncbi:hypothetical protein BD310DRAFT_946272 [Dichomitus squalens]|uniref:Uncharacterized protein n=1 Tax=Dichomitus squalens TaxID=114155 RepID=A0A4Q9Q3F8_9APHY|nr:hypothetical protein BD310DRAFT_946272 [Dichomitus squalens]